MNLRPFVWIAVMMMGANWGWAQALDEVFAEGSWDIRAAQGKKQLLYRLAGPVKKSENRRYPLVVFLHGAGERGSDNRAQLKYLPTWMSRDSERNEFPCYLLAPQCPRGQSWVDVNWSDPNSTPLRSRPTDSLAGVSELIDHLIATRSIDPSRVYLTGLSMGGYGSWDLATRRPELFAALVPICGGGDESQVARLVGLPIWAHHGADDVVVPPQRSRVMIEALKRAGGDPKYNEYEGCGHDSWTPTYAAKSGVLKWMFAQTRRPTLLTGGKEQLAKAMLKRRAKIAFLGDSITQAGASPQGYIGFIESALQAKGVEAVEFVKVGISGNRVPDLQARLERDVLKARPDLVFVYIGINDVWHSQAGRGTPIEDFESGLRKLVDRMQKAGAQVVLATPSVIGEKRALNNPLDEMLERFSARSRRVAAELGLELCDLRREFCEYLEAHNTQDLTQGVLTSDGVHLNRQGNLLVADRVAASLAKALARP